MNVFQTVLCCLLLLRVEQALAGYELDVQVFRYRNPSHRGLSIPTGQCCTGSCSNNCNNRLRLCLRPSGTAEDDFTRCTVGEPLYTTSVLGSDDELFSNDNLLGLPNPLLFSGDVWPGSAQLYVIVDHIEDGQAVLVDRIFIELQRNPGLQYSNVQSYLGEGGFGILFLQYRLRCQDGSSGLNCSAPAEEPETAVVTPSITPAPPNDERGESSSANAGAVAGGVLAAIIILVASAIVVTVVLAFLVRRHNATRKEDRNTGGNPRGPGDNPTYSSTSITVSEPSGGRLSTHGYEYVSTNLSPQESQTHSHSGVAMAGQQAPNDAYSYVVNASRSQPAEVSSAHYESLRHINGGVVHTDSAPVEENHHYEFSYNQ